MPTAQPILQHWHSVVDSGNDKYDSTPVFTADFAHTKGKDRLATGGADKCVRIWRVIDRPKGAFANAAKATSASLSPSPLASTKAPVGATNPRAGSSTAHQHDPLPVQFLATMKGHTKSVNVVRFSPNGRYLASAGDDATVLIWKLSDVPVASQPAFGADEGDVPNVENWKQIGALRGCANSRAERALGAVNDSILRF